jgi:hypothetical protein
MNILSEQDKQLAHCSGASIATRPILSLGDGSPGSMLFRDMDRRRT